jgi:hypothetical protein
MTGGHPAGWICGIRSLHSTERPISPQHSSSGGLVAVPARTFIRSADGLKEHTGQDKICHLVPAEPLPLETIMRHSATTLLGCGSWLARYHHRPEVTPFAGSVVLPPVPSRSSWLQTLAGDLADLVIL